jgi:ATP-dependent protease Clp ATPase subunit
MSDQPIIFCAFCSRPQTCVGILVAAPDGSTAICDDCLDLAIDVVRVTKEDRAAAASWLKREANPEWQKGLHKFVEPHEDTNSSDL